MIRKPGPMMFSMHVDLYNYTVHVLHAHTPEYCDRFLKRRYKGLVGDVDRNRSTARTHVLSDQNEGYIESVIEFPALDLSTIWAHETITHECLHAALHIADHLNIAVTADIDEPIAYLLGYLVGQCYEKLFQCA